MEQIIFKLLILNILICSIKTQSIDEHTSVGVIPNWLGTFYTTAECDIEKCCCIYGLITLSKMKPNYLRIVTQLVGYDCPINREIDDSITMPTSFTTELFLISGSVDITLNKDNNVIKLHNPNAPVCDGSAIRNNARSINQIQMVLIILTVFIGKNIFYVY